ncbi:MAG: hypothetical protein J6C81_04225 [Muribaculaceae bacterium]|nr:hypothetical protein [Muribaculaceae bacterium]
MRLSIRYIIAAISLAAVSASLISCDDVVEDRIPAYPVNINLADMGMWNSYGVSGFGVYRYFIKNQQPAGFPYTEATYTGFGGVLLIGGMDPYMGNTSVTLAYDLACPVEVDPNVRVRIDNENFNAVCPKCGSVYDVTMAGGAPVSGPAAAPSARYRLQNYQVLGTTYGGYVIIR